MPDSTPVPERAVTAAAEVLARALRVPGEPVTPGLVDVERALARQMLEAAAPAIREAERQAAHEAARQVMFENTDAAIAKATGTLTARIAGLERLAADMLAALRAHAILIWGSPEGPGKIAKWEATLKGSSS